MYQQQTQLLEQTADVVIQAMYAFEDMKKKRRVSARTSDPPENNHQFNVDICNNELNMPQFSYDRLLSQCGIAPGEEDGIPHFHRLLAIPGLSKAERKSIIKKTFTEQVWYREAKVRPYSTLVTMVDKRDFEEDTLGSTRRSAAKGLTIFAVPTMSDLEYNKINDTADALEKATTTTVKDISSSSFQAESLKTFAQLLTLIKRFVNLLYAIFGKFCPLLLELDKVVKFLEEYGETAISRMSKNTMASVTWIIHLQARHFTDGLMVPPNPFIPEFILMSTALQTKQQVTYGDVPIEMIERNPTPPPPSFTSTNNNPPRQQSNYNQQHSNNGNNNKHKYGGRTELKRNAQKLLKQKTTTQK